MSGSAGGAVKWRSITANRYANVGVLQLNVDGAWGVTPAPIASADYLAGLDLTSETFTAVGYGTDAYITGSAFANWTFSARCAGPNLEYRVDSPAAQEFLETYL